MVLDGVKEYIESLFTIMLAVRVMNFRIEVILTMF